MYVYLLIVHYLYTITQPDKYGKPQIDLSDNKGCI